MSKNLSQHTLRLKKAKRRRSDGKEVRIENSKMAFVNYFKCILDEKRKKEKERGPKKEEEEEGAEKDEEMG